MLTDILSMRSRLTAQECCGGEVQGLKTPVQVIEAGRPRMIPGGEITLGDIALVLRRRRWSIIFSLAAFLCLVTLYCTFATRRYQATGEIQIQKEGPGAFGLESSVLGDASGASDALDYNVALQTEANILQSDMLAQKVIEDLHLEPTKDFFPPPKAETSSWRLKSRLLFWRKPLEPLSIPLEDAPNRRYAAVKIFEGHLKVEPVTSTRLIRVSYSSPDPKTAAAVVNDLIAALREYTFQARFAATADASNWLAGQLSDLKKQTEALQAKAAHLQRDTGIFGEDGSHNIVVERLETLGRALAAAESNRILKGATYQVARSGDPDLISGLSGNSLGGTAGTMSNSLALIQTLRAQQAAVQAEMDEDQVRYGKNFPKIAEMQAELKGLRASIAEEVHRVGERAGTDYQIAVRAEAAARAAFDQQKKVANQMNDKAIAFGLAKQEADGSRDLYEGLLAKLKQAGVLEGLHATNITVVNPAHVPPTNDPRSPNLPLYYAAALFAGLVFGCLLAFVRELVDHNIHSIEEIEEILDAPPLCILPKLAGAEARRSAGLLLPRIGKMLTSSTGTTASRAHTHGFMGAFSPFVESLRGLRTSLLLSLSSHPPQVVLLTSSVAGEGKSTICLNLAMVLARQGGRILLVEADLRCPVLHNYVAGQQDAGLSAALSSDAVAAVPIPVEGTPNLSVLLSGPVPPFPAELLGSERMSELLLGWRSEYDFILIDSPPVLPVTDAILLSQISDAVVLVARHEFTARKALQRSFRALSRQLPPHVVIGTVLNAVSSNSNEFYEYYGYSGESYGADRRSHHAQA